jgi:CDGSH-type Zn-finger protein
MAKPVVVSSRPVVLELEPGDYWWCGCGRSRSQPFCDGSHKGTGIGPTRLSLDRPRRVALCQCKATADAPLCDGSHRGL